MSSCQSYSQCMDIHVMELLPIAMDSVKVALITCHEEWKSFCLGVSLFPRSREIQHQGRIQFTGTSMSDEI